MAQILGPRLRWSSEGALAGSLSFLFGMVEEAGWILLGCRLFDLRSRFAYETLVEAPLLV